MAYNLRSFIRKVPRNDFKEYLAKKYPDIAFNVDFLIKKKDDDKFTLGDKKYIDYITTVIQGLEEEQQLSINRDCELSYIITQDDIAINALNDALEFHGTTLNQSFCLERQSPESKALIVQINFPEVMGLAIKYHSMDKYSNGSKHSQYRIAGGFGFKDDDETKERFEQAINVSVNKKHVLNLKTKTEWLERTLENGETVKQIIFYREKPPSAVQRFNNNEVETDFLLFVSEGAIRFNPKTGMIDITGEGGKEFHESIKENFQEILLEQAPEDQEVIKKVEPRDINFSIFNTKPNFEPYYNGFFTSVEVESITLISGKVYYIINNKSDGDRDAYQQLKSFAKLHDIATSKYRIQKVGIRCIIQSNETDDEEIISFDLTYPNKSNLPNQHSIHQKPIETLLSKMKIISDG
jgi:hypothetical protein